MEIPIHNADRIPLPPQETKIHSLSGQAWPDGRRVQVRVETTPFQQRPNLHICILNDQGLEVASMIVTQILRTQLEFTLHLRAPETQGRYTVAAHLTYPDLELDSLGRIESSFEITSNH